VARRRGWVGDPPGNDEEAAERIVAAAVKLIAQRGAAVSIADVAAELGVIRQTVYRYFPTADAVMKAAAFASVDGFLDQLAAAVQGITDPADAMVEGVLFALEEVARTPHLGTLLSESYGGAHTGDVASETAQGFGLRMLARFDVDRAQYGYDESAKRDLVEFTLRVMLSFFVAPNDASRSREELRRFLRDWLGSAILARRTDADGGSPRQRPGGIGA
jgi:AcrR family transcriptional regulator